MAALLSSTGTGMAWPVYPLAGNGTANGTASVPDYVLKYGMIWRFVFSVSSTRDYFGTAADVDF